MGLCAYIFPILLFAGVTFLIVNNTNRLAYKKVLAGVVFFVFLCGFLLRSFFRTDLSAKLLLLFSVRLSLKISFSALSCCICKKTKEKNKKIAERKTGCGEGEPGRRI